LILFKKESSYGHVFADQHMVVFQYGTTTTSVSLRLWMQDDNENPASFSSSPSESLSFSLDLQKGFIQKSLPWQGHSSVQHMFCSLQTQDLPHITFPLQEHTTRKMMQGFHYHLALE
jgi:hypothetical protein